MKRTISSRYTRLNKVFSALVPTAVFVTVVLSIIGGSLPLVPVGAIALALSSGALAFFGWPYARLCYVGMDENNLYVSRGSKESVIPLTAVDDIYFAGVLGLVVVRLKSRADFGDKITFMPPLMSRRYRLRSHPVVDELKAFVKKASANSDAAI